MSAGQVNAILIAGGSVGVALGIRLVAAPAVRVVLPPPVRAASTAVTLPAPSTRSLSTTRPVGVEPAGQVKLASRASRAARRGSGAVRSVGAVETTVAQPLGIGLDEALARMEEAYLERVAAALRSAHPVPDTVVAAFGGAGPMTLCGAARRAGVTRIIVPRTAIREAIRA